MVVNTNRVCHSYIAIYGIIHAWRVHQLYICTCHELAKPADPRQTPTVTREVQDSIHHRSDTKWRQDFETVVRVRYKINEVYTLSDVYTEFSSSKIDGSLPVLTSAWEQQLKHLWG